MNTDADNQYCAEDIQKLIQPILDGTADMVVGARPIDDTEHFSFMKKKLQHLGSWAVRKASNTDIPDAPSGFRYTPIRSLDPPGCSTAYGPMSRNPLSSY